MYTHRKTAAKKTLLSHKHLLVTVLFIIAASLLVVLTTFSINMLTATGDFNRIAVKWSDQNGQSDTWITNYLQTGNFDFIHKYEESVENRMYIGDVVDELLSDNPNSELIFNEFNPDEIHPNEITGLIRTFTLFSESPEVQNLKETWNKLHQLNTRKAALADSIIYYYQNDSVFSEDRVQYFHSEFEDLSQQIHANTRLLILNSSDILLLLKRFSLWITVLLGIIIVIVGVIFTVRGVKNINHLQDVLNERDYLALFPEVNQFPVLNVTSNGKLSFANQAARSIFPNILEKGMDHPFLSKLSHMMATQKHKEGLTTLEEVKVADKYYQQAINYLSEEKGIHVHSIDITQLKNQQIELSKALDEKSLLLGEVHHRVKNNMAVISGLLELQEMMGNNPEKALSESRHRIKSMALVHELLYQSEEFSSINLNQYLQKLSRQFQTSLSSVNQIKVQGQNELIELNINQAIPLGLLLNELMHYLSLKASISDTTLSINMEIIRELNNICIRLTSPVSGIKNPLNQTSAETLQQNLITNLLDQIEANLYMPESKELIIELKFELSDKKGSGSSYL